MGTHQPNFNNLYSSSFRTTKDLLFLDLTKDIASIQILSTKYDITSMLKFYPFTIACSYRTKYRDAKFNDEYIVPNILLQWVLEDKNIHGLKFLSVKYCNNNYQEKLYNYVLPPKEFHNVNYCNTLKSYFEVTNPMSFAILMYGPNPGNVIAYELVKGNDAESALLNTYWTTIFGRTEMIIKNLPHFPVLNT